ncbi:cation/H(+) antiporter 15-like [Neltuma alba]|uniref:cation/H(+) antiporter 15-like n=1 Tax=Neltuma alba TaxID=207710 RepID=UPI0010A4405D|nr:cation/H(+) antiporter 15-like [Prosopis alba]
MQARIWQAVATRFISSSAQWHLKSPVVPLETQRLCSYLSISEEKAETPSEEKKKGEAMLVRNPNVCYNLTVKNANQVWKTSDIYGSELPILAVQLFWTIFVTRIFIIIARPLHLPSLVAEVIAGFMLSMDILGQIPIMLHLLFPVRGILDVNVMSSLGLIFYAFLTGLQMNLDNVLRASKKAFSIAVSGVVIPMVMGAIIFALHRKTYTLQIDETIENDPVKACLLWSICLTVTGFPLLAEILASLKLLYTELGRSALDAAIVSDSFSWLLFMLVIPFTLNHGAGAIYTVVGTIAFITFCIVVVRPVISPIIDQKTDREEWNDHQLLFVLMGTVMCAYITDILGSGIVGAFVFGLILPHGRFTNVMMSAADDFASGVLAPLVFFGSGMRIDLTSALSHKNWTFSVMVIVLLCIPKILSTLIATFAYGIPFRDGLSLGVLMNTKGVMALIMLNIGWDREILAISSYSILVTAVVIMTIATSVITNIAYRPRKQCKMNKMRTVQNSRLDTELRILACVHNNRHASSMVKILECFHASGVSPLYVGALYLVELTSRGAFVLLDHMSQHVSPLGTQYHSQSQAELEGINNTFQELAGSNDAVQVETFNILSSYKTIHEDIWNTANEKHTNLILLPFHKQVNTGGCLEMLNSAYKDINYNIMQEPPCSVGIFIDRGVFPLSKTTCRILMIFVGGPDDREALAVAWRMATYPGVHLSLVRMLYHTGMEVELESNRISSTVLDSSKQKKLDDEYVDLFRIKAIHNEDSISYSEKEVHVGEDIPELLNELDQGDYHLYIVGQGRGRNCVLFSGLMEWCDCPELGAIGDILASNSFGSKSSVLIVQQYGYDGTISGNAVQKHPNDQETKEDGFGTLINHV